jgi:hypothetical protein
MTPEFRAGERDRGSRLLCCDCGEPAEGNITCDDGNICDACHEACQRETLIPLYFEDFETGDE